MYLCAPHSFSEVVTGVIWDVEEDFGAGVVRSLGVAVVVAGQL